MTSKRIEEIQKKTAYPYSVSARQALQQALLQVWNEIQQQEYDDEICKNCNYLQPDFNNTCSIGICIPEDMNEEPDLTFGCNKFELK